MARQNGRANRATRNGWESVADMIRRNNHGYLASEVSAGSAPGGTATVTPGPYLDTRRVGTRKYVPEIGGMSTRKHNVEWDVPVARNKDGRPIPMPADPSTLGGNPIGGFGTPGEAQGRYSDGSPIPGALPSFMPYDERFPGTQDWLRETFGKEAARGVGDAVAGLGPGMTATVTGKGATGVRISGRSPMAVEPGTNPEGSKWDLIRAGIHNQATKQAIARASRDNPIYGQGVDLMDKADTDAKSKTFQEQVKVNEDALASHFVDNLTQSIRDDVDKNWKPAAPTAAQAAEADTRAKVGTGATPEERRGNLDAWNAARKAGHAEEVQRHQESMMKLDDTEKWISGFAAQNGLKDPTQGAAKGGNARDGLDALISELDGFGPAERLSGERELTGDEVTEWEAARTRARDAGLPVDDPRYRRDGRSGKVYRRWSRFDLSEGERGAWRDGPDAEVAALRAMYDYMRSGGEGARSVRDIRSLAWNLRRNRAIANGGR